MQIVAPSELTYPVVSNVIAINAIAARRTSPRPGWVTAAPLVYNGGVIVQRHQKTWTHLSATLDHVEADHGFDIVFDADVACISILLEEVGGTLQIRAGGRSEEEGAGEGTRSGPISVIPAGFKAKGRARQMRFLRHLVIQFDEEELRTIADQSGFEGDQLIPNLMFLDQNVVDIARLIANECQATGWGGLLYGDSLTAAMMVALTRVKPPQPAKIVRGGLTPLQLRRAQSYMLENVSEAVTLRELADMTRVSLAHFCRAFKVSTGRAPHQWLIDARIARAKSHLVDKDLSISQIALTLGFCDQAHFTRTFSKVVGVTPLAWQRR